MCLIQSRKRNKKNEGEKTDEPKNLAVDFCVQRMSANWLWILILDLLQAIWKFDKLKNQTFKKISQNWKEIKKDIKYMYMPYVSSSKKKVLI